MLYSVFYYITLLNCKVVACIVICMLPLHLWYTNLTVHSRTTLFVCLQQLQLLFSCCTPVLLSILYSFMKRMVLNIWGLSYLKGGFLFPIDPTETPHQLSHRCRAEAFAPTLWTKCLAKVAPWQGTFSMLRLSDWYISGG